ncbi:hypothetical protein [Methanobrevibacter smithii]|uniref:hypothetical protein n=1 Tax=Methanobrevibacter smithii TaxID=2173 RepID=UPI00384F79BB
MKAKRLIEILRSVSPNAEIMCCISTDDLEEVTNMTLAPFKHKNYEIFCVLIADGDDSCRLLLKKNPYQYNPKGVRNKSSIVDERYNMDFINEMKNIEQEKPIPINCQQLEEEHEKNKKLEENYYKISADLMQKLRAINKLLNDLYEGINRNYIETLGRDDELAIDCADAQLQLIKKIIDKVEKI